MKASERKRLKEKRDKIIKGLELTYIKLVKFKKEKNSPLVVSKNGKVVRIAPEDIPATAKYEH